MADLSLLSLPSLAIVESDEEREGHGVFIGERRGVKHVHGPARPTVLEREREKRGVGDRSESVRDILVGNQNQLLPTLP